MNKRRIVAKVMFATGAITLLTSMRTRLADHLTILVYHRVLDVPDESAFPFDVELVSASTHQFRRQMEYLRRHFQPTTFESVLRARDAGEMPPRGSAIVTFDDGFSDNYEHAFPILRDLGMPATVFLSTGYIDQQELPWYERLAYAVMTTPPEALRSAGLELDGPSDPASRRALIERTLRRLKQVPNGERTAMLDRIFRVLPDGDGWRKDGRSAPLTWEQVREMSACGIEFGSHTVNHPVLSKVPTDELDYELAGSKRRIEQEIGKPIEVIAYPVGGEEAFDGRVRQAVSRAGYKLGVSYIPGVDRPDSWDPYALRRLHVERYLDMSYFRAMLAAPDLFS